MSDFPVNLTLSPKISQEYVEKGLIKKTTEEASKSASFPLPKLFQFDLFNSNYYLTNKNLGLTSSVIFLSVLGGALIYQQINRSLNVRRVFVTVMIAIVLATVPLSLNLVMNTTSMATRADITATPRNIIFNEISQKSLKIAWETLVPTVGGITYGIAPLSKDRSAYIISDNGKMTKEHSAVLNNLIPGMEYEAEIFSGKIWYDNQGQPLKFKFDP